MTAVTILHELVHHGGIVNSKRNKGETGNVFERNVYGTVIGVASGTYKSVLDNWLKRNSGNSSSSSTIYLYQAAEPESNKNHKKKKKQPDADEKRRKATGG